MTAGIIDLPLFIAAGLLVDITSSLDLGDRVGRWSTHGVRAGVATALRRAQDA